MLDVEYMSGMNPTPYKAIEGVYEEVESVLSKELLLLLLWWAFSTLLRPSFDFAKSKGRPIFAGIQNLA
jgi:hypothetical protein